MRTRGLRVAHCSLALRRCARGRDQPALVGEAATGPATDDVPACGSTETSAARGSTTSNLSQRACASSETDDARGSTTSNLSQRACASSETDDARGSTTSNLSQRACASSETDDARGSTTSNLSQRACAGSETDDARGSTTSNLSQRGGCKTQGRALVVERRAARRSTTPNLLQRRSRNTSGRPRRTGSTSPRGTRHTTLTSARRYGAVTYMRPRHISSVVPSPHVTVLAASCWPFTVCWLAWELFQWQERFSLSPL